VAGFEDASGGRLREGLALEEATALTHANPVYGKIKPDHVGLPLSDTACALVDVQDPARLAAPGTRGQLAVNGPQVMKGDWNDPEATAATVVDGWLLTGLLAEVDSDGYYCVLGRIDGAAP
jgi:long-chain acyl-CoA synthetase